MTVARFVAPALAATAVLLPATGFAHPGDHAHGNVGAGFAHPFFGPDHLLAMVAVGLWAVSLGGRALWALPAAFVAAMTAGLLTAYHGLDAPVVESIITGSVLVLGLVVAAGWRPRLALGAALVALAGFAHGQAHGVEMPYEATLAGYGLGMIAATALLHAAGIAFAHAAGRIRLTALSRAAGGAIALAGVLLVVQAG